VSDRVSLYVVPPSRCERPLHELHDILTSAEAAAMPCFFTLADGSHVFHVEVDGDADALELALIASGWVTVQRPD
jgi:hypothetical protein